MLVLDADLVGPKHVVQLDIKEFSSWVAIDSFSFPFCVLCHNRMSGPEFIMLWN